MNFAAFPDNLARVREEIERIKIREGAAGKVRIVAVTKGQPVAAILAAQSAGLLDVGENRVQEAIDKIDSVGESGVCWHMIGHLQRNKVRSAVQWATVYHSVDSLRLAEEISSEAGRRKQEADVLLQVNVAGEKSKYGIAVGAIEVFCEQIRVLAGMRLIGLMGMMPLVNDPEEVRPLFRRLREIAEDLVTQEYMSSKACELTPLS